jgi:hypothetical protein
VGTVSGWELNKVEAFDIKIEVGKALDVPLK